MKQSIILWLGAFVVVFLAGYLNSVISGDYPVTGTIGVDGQKVSYRFDKKYYTKESYDILIRSDVENLDAIVQWKRKNEQSWNEVIMKQSGTMLSARMPQFYINDTVEYRVKVNRNDKTYLLPGKEPVVMSFTGKLPGTIAVLWFITLYAGLLFSTRTGLEYFKNNDKTKRLSFLTLVFFFLYNFVNPVKETFALDTVNNRIPSITELFDVHAILFLLLWIAGMWSAFKSKNSKLPVLVISILVILVFLFVKM